MANAPVRGEDDSLRPFARHGKESCPHLFPALRPDCQILLFPDGLERRPSAKSPTAPGPLLIEALQHDIRQPFIVALTTQGQKGYPARKQTLDLPVPSFIRPLLAGERRLSRDRPRTIPSILRHRQVAENQQRQNCRDQF